MPLHIREMDFSFGPHATEYGQPYVGVGTLRWCGRNEVVVERLVKDTGGAGPFDAHDVAEIRELMKEHGVTTYHETRLKCGKMIDHTYRLVDGEWVRQIGKQ